jgi:hypothetical protein
MGDKTSAATAKTTASGSFVSGTTKIFTVFTAFIKRPKFSNSK